MFGGFKGIITDITESDLIKNTKAEKILELENTNVKFESYIGSKGSGSE